MKKYILFLLLMCVTVNLYSQGQQFIEAIVNDDIITSAELDMFLRPLYIKYSKAYEGKELQEKMIQAKKKALWRLIDQKIISQEAKKQEVKVQPEYIRKHMNKIKSRFNSEEEFLKAINSDGMSIKAFEDKVKEQYLVKALTYREIASHIVVSPKEAQNYYNQNEQEYFEKEKVNVSHILIRKEKYDNALDIITDIKEQIDADKNSFGKLAQEYSYGSTSNDSGELGFFTKGQLMPILEEKAFTLDVGDVSHIIESNIGYHIIQVNAKKKERIKPLTEVYEEIHKKLYQQKTMEKQEKWVVQLREKAHIRILNKNIK